MIQYTNVALAQWIEHPPYEREDRGSSPLRVYSSPLMVFAPALAGAFSILH